MDIDDPVEYQTYLGALNDKSPSINKETLQLQVDAYKSAFSHTSQSISEPTTPKSKAKSELSDSESIDLVVVEVLDGACEHRELSLPPGS